VRALVRDPDAAASRDLVSLGATVTRADLGDAASLCEAFTGAAAGSRRAPRPVPHARDGKH
jgi:uncharacterized protein YbjT (DUF2867 family)